MSCTFCGQENYLPAGGDHPCCIDARATGEKRCAGCESFRRRCWDCGNPVPRAGERYCRKRGCISSKQVD